MNLKYILICLFIFFLNNAKGQTTVSKNDSIANSKIIEGRYVYSIINNGGHYFLIDLPIFEDGVVSCWENVEFRNIKTKISSGWISPNAPNNERIDVHQLASWEIKSSKWYYNQENYYDFILSVVKSMNPNLTNLYDSSGQSSKANRNTNFSYLYSGYNNLYNKNHKKDNSFKKIRSQIEHYLLKKSEAVYWLCNFNIYADGSILVDGYGDSLYFNNKEELEPLIKNGTFATQIPDNSTIIFHNLGEIQIVNTLYSVSISDRFLEIDDIISSLNNKPTTMEKCYIAYNEFEKNPTEENRLKLMETYEKVPWNNRINMFRRMNYKGSPILKIIYKNENPIYEPLFIVDGKEVEKFDFKNFHSEEIESMKVIKVQDAIDKYGNKGKNGVIEIILNK